VNLPVVNSIHTQHNKFVTGVKTDARGDLKLNDSATLHYLTLSIGTLSRSFLENNLDPKMNNPSGGNGICSTSTIHCKTISEYEA